MKLKLRRDKPEAAGPATDETSGAAPASETDDLPPAAQDAETASAPESQPVSASTAQPTAKWWWCGSVPAAAPEDRNPLWFVAYRTRRFLTSFGIVFLFLGVMCTALWAEAYSDVRLVCDPLKPIGFMSWGSMAAAALACYGIGVILFGMAKLSDLAQARHDELTAGAFPPDISDS